jgi:integrase
MCKTAYNNAGWKEDGFHRGGPGAGRVCARTRQGSTPRAKSPSAARRRRACTRKRANAPGSSRVTAPATRPPRTAQEDDRAVALFFRLMKAYCQRANIPVDRARPHALKHFCGMHHLGHRDIRSTMIYAKVVNPSREKAAEQLRDWQ